MADQPTKPDLSNKPPSKKLGAERNSAKKVILGIVGLLLVVWLLAGAFILYRSIDGQLNNQPITQRDSVANDGNQNKSEQETAIAGVIDKVSPSVVSILTQTTVENYFFGTSSVQEGAGSGFIVSEDGYIITNRHVVEDARTVSVILSDGTTYEDAQVVATDPLNDLAYLKVPDVSGLPVAELGDSTTVRVGQSVIAIGNSLGQYQNTVTSGIISGTGRPVAAQKGNSVETLTDLLQTDAAINPGNSGGPLLNTSGQVIGINTAIAQDAEGIGFAIPITAAKGILKQVLDGKDAERAYLGVRYIPVNAAVAKRFELSVDRGAYISADRGARAVVSGSPADDAGLRDGDVITKINDVEVGPGGGVASLIAEYAPGDTVEIIYVRGDETRTTRVTLSAF